MTATSRCPECDVELPRGVIGGLCPACLLRQGLRDSRSMLAEKRKWSDVTRGPNTPGRLTEMTASLESLPQTLLRDTDPGPLVLTGTPEMPPASDRPGRLQLLGEIARGGMGAILKGRDNDIGRELAIKVLLDSHRGQPDLVRRFIEEAQIGGQLQHPGIVPIYELGALPDRRPYFAMKLVKGRTLAALLDERPDPARELPRFLSIFETICQTIAYAHARGVIHRDLKPSNIMVGSFGEVQVMDWGLAKVLPQGGAVDDASAGKTRDRETVITTARSGSDNDSDLSRAGSVMGTPSYMAPEQARGEVERLDERCDVFALGSILCELLSGEPAFTGRSSGEIQRKASRGELQEAQMLLEKSGADADLIALARECLASELEDRPRHAGVVAGRIMTHRIGVEERLRLAEIARAEEETRAAEAVKRARIERDRLRLTVALAASIFGLVMVAGGGWAYVSRLQSSRRAATERHVTRAIGEANVLFGQAKAAAVGDLARWPDVIAALKQARSLLLAGEPSRVLQNQIDELRVAVDREHANATRRADEAGRDRRFVERLERIRVEQFEQGRKWDRARTDAHYAAAFREFGIDIDQLDPAEAGRKLTERSNPLELALFLDDWALVRHGDDGQAWQRPIAAARATDPDPWRDALRRQIGHADREFVNRLSRDETALQAQPPRSLLLLAQVLEAQDNKAQAEKVLIQAWRRHPDDFWTCSQLARTGGSQGVRFASIAAALRPENAWARAALAEALASANSSMSFAMSKGGESGCHTIPDSGRSKRGQNFPRFLASTSRPQALDSFYYIVYPEWSEPHCVLYNVWPYKFLVDDEIIQECKEAIRLQPNEAFHHNRLANVLVHQEGNLDLAIAEFRQAIRLTPRDFDLRYEFARHLALNGKVEEAIREYDEASRIDPKAVRWDLYPENTFRLFVGSLLQKEGKLRSASSQLRRALLLTDNNSVILEVAAAFLHLAASPAEEIEAFRQRLRSHPDEEFSLVHLGELLRSQGKPEEENALYEEAIRRSPADRSIRQRFARALAAQGKSSEAKAQRDIELSLFRDAVRTKPDDAQSHTDLAWALFDRGRWTEASAELREAARLAPAENPFATLAGRFGDDGKLDRAIALYREAVRRQPGDLASHFGLGVSSLEFGDADSAIAEIREALRLSPNPQWQLAGLGRAQLEHGHVSEALASFREASRLHGIGAMVFGIEEPLDQAKRLVALQGRLDAILRGEEIPASADEKLDVADLCRVTRRFVAASKFYHDAFQAKPALAEELWTQNRLHAAMAAARAGTQSNAASDDLSLDEAGRARAKSQALEWLHADTSLCKKLLARNKEVLTREARKALDIMTHHRDLTALRDENEIKKLPEDERKAWTAMWAEVNALIAMADR